mmetsp:Transcript_32056/g.102113  ORF Transcript_32056/g.102113 Transcript_32056/m.102113 type:complete len:85 (-) Transcript_32056:184-438(-)
MMTKRQRGRRRRPRRQGNRAGGWLAVDFVFLCHLGMPNGGKSSVGRASGKARGREVIVLGKKGRDAGGRREMKGGRGRRKEKSG